MSSKQIKMYRRKTVPKKYMTLNSKKRYTLSKRINIKNNIYYFSRYVSLGTIQASNSIPEFQALFFALSDVPNYLEFVDLFDMYKINAVKITFTPKQNSSISIGSVNNADASSRFFSAIDYNDGTIPVSIDELREYQTAKFTSVIKTHTRYIYKPKIIDSSGAYNPNNPWINTASSSAIHYGLKTAIEPINSTSTTAMLYTVECKYYMSFRNVH